MGRLFASRLGDSSESLPRTSLILGILYLAFQAFPIIFTRHGFNQEFIGLSFLGLGVGMVLASLSQPFWNRYWTDSLPFPPQLIICKGLRSRSSRNMAQSGPNSDSLWVKSVVSSSQSVFSGSHSRAILPFTGSCQSLARFPSERGFATLSHPHSRISSPLIGPLPLRCLPATVS